ncbi:MAG: hypothetical protein ACE5OZ_22755 [Candidatus Heimdallarchaeota archaeon]
MLNFWAYLVLSGQLKPGESFLLQKVINSQELAIRQARKDLRKEGFSNSSNIIEGLHRKKLLKVSDNSLAPDWKGISTLVASIQGVLAAMVHEVWSLKNTAEKEAEAPISTEIRSHSALRNEEILTWFKGNKPVISERKLLQELPPLETIEAIEWLSELGALRIQKKKKSRSLTLTAEGASLRYLFLTETRNSANYDYLEQSLLSSQDVSWASFLERIQTPEEREGLPSVLQFLLRLFKELRLLACAEDGSILFEQPSELSSLNNAKALENWISGFIPVYVENLWRVLVELPADTATLRQETELGASSVSGIVSMLAKFKLARKDSKKNIWRLTKGGKNLAKLSEEEFSGAFRRVIESFPIFNEVITFIQQQPEAKAGFLDLAGYFRANGVGNFNPAKALAILRIMEQTGLGLEAVAGTGESGMYQLVDSAN